MSSYFIFFYHVSKVNKILFLPLGSRERDNAYCWFDLIIKYN